MMHIGTKDCLGRPAERLRELLAHMRVCAVVSGVLAGIHLHVSSTKGACVKYT